jgi:DNA-binding NarL/FixJ family response regulator
MKALIAVPQPTLRRALNVWMSGQPDWEVIGEASDSFDLLAMLNHLSQGVVILDCDLPGLPVEKLVRQVRQNSTGVTIILLTNGPLELLEDHAMDVDFNVSKDDSPTRMLETISKARNRLQSKSIS